MRAIARKLVSRLRQPNENFSGHYIGWRAKRVAAILEHYQPSFFFERSVLELGCGYGDIGGVFAKLGARVVCSDARESHLRVVRKHHPEIKTIRVDLESEWPFGSYDLIIHMGVLYHLSSFEKSLEKACRSSQFMVLETEVSDSDDPSFVMRTAERGYDQAVSGIGIRPTAEGIERVLASCGMKYQRISDARCNHGIHRYDWPVTNSKTWEHGLRRFWFVERG